MSGDEKREIPEHQVKSNIQMAKTIYELLKKGPVMANVSCLNLLQTYLWRAGEPDISVLDESVSREEIQKVLEKARADVADAGKSFRDGMRGASSGGVGSGGVSR